MGMPFSAVSGSLWLLKSSGAAPEDKDGQGKQEVGDGLCAVKIPAPVSILPRAADLRMEPPPTLLGRVPQLGTEQVRPRI